MAEASVQMLAAVNDPQDRFGHIFDHLPIALWQTDHTPLVQELAELRRRGVTDLDAFIDEHPRFLWHALGLVTVEAVNARTVVMFGGTSPGDFVGSTVERFWRRSPQTFRRSICARFAGAASYSEQTEAFDLDGRVLPIEFSITFAPPLDGRNLSVVSVIDIRERLRADEAVRASAEHYRRLFRNIPHPLVQLDLSGVYRLLAKLREEHGAALQTYIETAPDFPARYAESIRLQEGNLAAARLFGLTSPEEFPHSISHVWVTSPEVLRRSCLARLRGDPGYSEETRINTLDGQIKDVIFEITFATILPEPHSNVAAFIDISDRVLAEAALGQLRANFAHAARVSLVGELAGSIAHEVSQPLTAIIATGGMMQRWLNRPEPDLAELRGLAADVVADGERAAAVIANIRDLLARREQDRVPISVNAIVEDVVTFLGREMTETGTRLEFEGTEGLPHICADRTQIQQVLVNLIINAAQAMDQHGSPIRSILIATELVGASEVRVAVSDTGPGIAPEIADHVFDSFVTTKKSGLGIGLSICRSIIESHGGQLRAANRDDGAVFSFTLPAA